MIVLRESANRWSMEVAHFDVPLQTGLRLRIEGKAVTYREPKPEKPADVLKCQVLSWEYQIADAENASVVVVVEDFDAPGISDNWAFTAMGLAGVTGLVLLIEAHAFYLNHEEAWAFFGNNARWVGAIALAVLFLGIIPWRTGLRKKTGFRELFLTGILFWSGTALIVLWWRLSSPDGLSDAALGHAIAAKLKADNWPLLIAALPWVALIFKLLGFEVAEKTTGVVIEAAKTKE